MKKEKMGTEMINPAVKQRPQAVPGLKKAARHDRFSMAMTGQGKQDADRVYSKLHYQSCETRPSLPYWLK